MSIQATPSSKGWPLMMLILGIEVVAGAVLLWQTARLVTAGTNDPLGQRISLLLVVILGLIWGAATLYGAVRRRSWARAANLTLQVLLIAAAVGVLQGILGDPLVGALLLIVAVLGCIASLMIRPAEHLVADSDSAST